jgi:hypothetical protein
MKTAYLFALVIFALCLTQAECAISPAWLENNFRHLSYGPVAWIIPGISKFWYVALMAYSYLGLMSGFGKQERVVQFFNDLVLLYLPMTGVQKANI